MKLIREDLDAITELEELEDRNAPDADLRRAQARVDAAYDAIETHIATGSADLPDPTPVALAHRFIRRHATHRDGPVLRRWKGDYYGWDRVRGCYRELSSDTIDSQLYRTLRLGNRRIVGDVRHALIAVDEVLIDHAELGSWLGDGGDVDPLDIAVAPNGLINLHTGDVSPSTPRYFATTALGVNYEPSAAAPTEWLEFLRQLWGDDEQSIATLQEWFGYMLTPDMRQQKILVTIGPPRSGKGTIMRVLEAMLGKGSVASPSLASLATNFGLSPLIGKTAALIQDARLGGRSDIAAIVERLLSISGQDPQTIDRKHRDPWNGYLSTRISIVSNEVPRFTDASGALASRFLALKLHKTFLGNEDWTLSARLIANELPGILNWSIEGWRRLRERGYFVQPESSAAVVRSVDRLAAPVAAWIEDRCVKGGSHVIKSDDAYRNFASWCAETGILTIQSKELFGRDMMARGHDKVRRRDDDGKPVWHYAGLALSATGQSTSEGSK